MTETEGLDVSDLHRAIGAIVANATSLELQLANAVTSLSRSPLTSILVQGERGSTLIGMARRLLDRGIGSSLQDETSGRSSRLGLISAEDTLAFKEALSSAETLLASRDAVVHSVWLANVDPGRVHGQRTTRSKQYVRAWTMEELGRLRQDLANVETDIFICTWNTSGSGMGRLAHREGDVG
ncbi:hypothetical protein [Nostocoides sp. HKS02]|uniref:hypothetical protein n=1 Tax=Nostocoides sp. HKS02 TaxID=1813880 RepID=UPI0012B49B0A|nr:hypothetical protein [Tetrasphaera sp. HKS02]QGN58856.1 hypothetical protein GKE56_14285 [Tetrasphaera sp. HKS02]